MVKALLVILVVLLILGTGSFYFLLLREDSSSEINNGITQGVENLVSNSSETIQNDMPQDNSFENEPKPEPEPTTQKITIANWNIEAFDASKANDGGLMDKYRDIIRDYDIVFVQGIQDEGAFFELCDMLSNRECRVSSKTSSVGSENQYGVIHRTNKDIDIDEWMEFSSDNERKWERPPLKVVFDIGKDKLIVYTLHAKPSNADKEISYLDDLIESEEKVDEKKIIVVGDLSADCNYYANDGTEFDSSEWTWIIKDDEDTIINSNDCAYDRIIMNDHAERSYLDDGILKEDIDENVSDHYLIWVEIEV